MKQEINNMKKTISILTLCISASYCLTLNAQVHTNQNEIKTSVTNTLSADGAQAKRFTIAELAYNTHHWQYGGILIVELFMDSYGPGYEKYILELGYGRGTGPTNPVLRLVESHGNTHLAILTLGTAYDLGVISMGYPNYGIPLYLDIRYYGRYKAKITYTRNRVATLANGNDIIINENPTGVDIPDFTVPTIPESNIFTSGNLRITGNGTHYISEGNLGIGTTTPTEKLAVNGTIRSKEVIVEATGWPDYVFADDYELPTLAEIEAFIKANKHLPDVPSAEQVEEQGQHIGEIQKQLLKKMEEMTLYMIELKKENELLKKEKEVNNAQQERIDQLIKRIEQLESKN